MSLSSSNKVNTPLTGSRVHRSQRIDDYGEPFGVGDVIGCCISLDDNPQLNKMIFFKNGVEQGIAFFGDEITPGVYFPAISVYMKVIRILSYFLFLNSFSII